MEISSFFKCLTFVENHRVFDDDQREGLVMRKYWDADESFTFFF